MGQQGGEKGSRISVPSPGAIVAAVAASCSGIPAYLHLLVSDKDPCSVFIRT